MLLINCCPNSCTIAAHCWGVLAMDSLALGSAAPAAGLLSTAARLMAARFLWRWAKLVVGMGAWQGETGQGAQSGV